MVSYGIFVSDIFDSTNNSYLERNKLLFVSIITYLYIITLLIGATNFDIIKAVFFYTLGAISQKTYSKNKCILFTLLFILLWGSIVCLTILPFVVDIVGQKIITKSISFLISAVLVPVSAWLFFNVFNSLNITENIKINKLAATTFGVYLLHDSRAVRYLLWNPILKIADYQITLPLFPIIALAEIVLIFSVCAFIDFLYQHLLEKRIINKFSVFQTF